MVFFQVLCDTAKYTYNTLFLDGGMQGYANRGVSYITGGETQTETSGTWITFAHEIGHNFNALHPFSSSAEHGTPSGASWTT